MEAGLLDRVTWTCLSKERFFKLRTTGEAVKGARKKTESLRPFQQPLTAETPS